ncbi:hypothetical protein EJ063_07535 [Vibrio aquaticus]|uniref:Uncharacterized protein n=1 Tax=Vibrio aquaticus TaxID=2496559 RepID=A0A432CZK1_9VIBR|nr:hypothetical protein [Vibrio aquaticus]RTZ16638.1 hypothetical protein EJ063_07535 [Vibrio aquaticus]
MNIESKQSYPASKLLNNTKDEFNKETLNKNNSQTLRFRNNDENFEGLISQDGEIVLANTQSSLKPESESQQNSSENKPFVGRKHLSDDGYLLSKLGLSDIHFASSRKQVDVKKSNTHNEGGSYIGVGDKSTSVSDPLSLKESKAQSSEILQNKGEFPSLVKHSFKRIKLSIDEKTGGDSKLIGITEDAATSKIITAGKGGDTLKPDTDSKVHDTKKPTMDGRSIDSSKIITAGKGGDTLKPDTDSKVHDTKKPTMDGRSIDSSKIITVGKGGDTLKPDTDSKVHDTKKPTMDGRSIDSSKLITDSKSSNLSITTVKSNGEELLKSVVDSNRFGSQIKSPLDVDDKRHINNITTTPSSLNNPKEAVKNQSVNLSFSSTNNIISTPIAEMKLIPTMNAAISHEVFSQIQQVNSYVVTYRKKSFLFEFRQSSVSVSYGKRSEKLEIEDERI